VEEVWAEVAESRILQAVSYRSLGQEPSPPGGAPASPPPLPPDVSPSFAEEMIQPVDRRRGWVAVPTFDMRQYVQTQFIVAAIGFGFGVTVGAILGDILTGKRIAAGRILGNRRRLRRNAGKRRTTARRRKRGRPTVKAVTSYEDWVKMPGGYRHVVIRRGSVHVGPERKKPSNDAPESKAAIGTVYDGGTVFRAVPRSWDAPVREFTTLAGAIKHIIRNRHNVLMGWESA